MAKKWKKNEIQEYLSTKQISQENYVAPTVQTNYQPSVQNTVQAFNSVQPTIKSVESTVQPTQTIKKQEQQNNNKSFSFSIDNKSKSEEDIKKDYDSAYDKLMAYKKEKGINLLNEKKYKNDKTYQNLLKDTQDKQKAWNDTKVNKKTTEIQKDLDETNPVASAVARTGIAFGTGATRGFEGIESSIRKLTGQEQETDKFNFNDPLLEKSMENASKGEEIAMNIAQSWGQMVPQMIAPGAKTATALGFLNYGGSAYNDAKKEGATEQQATLYGIASGSTEMFMEKLLGGFENIYGKKMSKDFASNVMSKLIKNKAVRDTLSGMKGEFTEEYLQEFLEPILKNIILKEENGADFWNTMKDDLGAGLKQLGSQLFNQQNLVAGLYGAASSGLMQGPINFANQNRINQIQNQQMQQQNIQEKPLEQVIRENLLQEEQQTTPQVQEQIETPTQTQLQTSNTNVSEQNNQIIGQQKTLQITPLNKVNQELEETRQQDIQNQVQALNLEKPQEFTQKQGNYVYEKSDNAKIDTLRKDAANYLKEGEQTTNFVNTLEKIVKDKDIEIRFDNKLGNNVNGTYKDGVITINPNSNRAGEFVAIHELTHAISTKTMVDMIQKYRKSNAEFNNAVEKLLTTYNTNEINEEALGDIAGRLFGNQEYINNLSMENPSLFKKIYNEIKYLWHQFTGYKNQDQFIEDLKNKWESAYRSQETKQNNTKYSIETLNDGEQYVKLEQGLFTNKDGSQMSQKEIYNSLIGKTIKFNDGIEATIKAYLPGNKNMYNELFKRRPTYQNVSDIKTINNKINENILELLETSDNISPNEPDFNDRHRKNKISSFDTRRVSLYDGSKAYDLDLSIAKMDNGEYVAYAKRNLKQNKDLSNKIKKEAPMSKSQGVLPLKNNISQSNKNVKSDISTKYSIQENENNTQDNKGRELSKQQQEYFKDAKTINNKGELIELYHGTPNNFTIFNTKDFGGANGTAEGFGIYLTDNIEVADDYLQHDKGKMMKLYANITKPATTDNLTINKQDIIKTIKELTYKEAQTMVDEGDYDNINDALKDTWISNYTYTYDKSIEESYNDVAKTILESSKSDFEVIQELMNGSGNNDYKRTNDFYTTITDTLGFDGIKTKWDFSTDSELKKKNADIWIAFKSNQIKNVDNINPTEDVDIRYSKGNQTWREYLEKEFPNHGTKTNLGEVNERNKSKKEKKITQENNTQELDNSSFSNEKNTINEDKKDEVIMMSNNSIESKVREKYNNLSEDKIQEIIKLKTEQKNKDDLYSTYSNQERAKQRKMINAYETNAKIRKIVQGNSLEKVENGLTNKELEIARVREESNYIGKKVLVDGKNAKVIGNPYGRVKVEFEDGNAKVYDRSEVISVATDSKGKRVDLKPTGENTYEQVNTPKPKQNEVISKEDITNKVLNIGDEKISNFYSNATEKSKFITEENRIQLMDNDTLKYYDAISNKETLQNALDKLDTNTEQQIGEFFAKKDFTAEDVATGWILVKRYQDAGNFEAMSNVIEKMREQGTKAGQTVQMYGILQRLTPEGMEYYAQKQLDNAYNRFAKNKSKKQIEKYANDFTLTSEEHQFIKDTMEKVNKLTDDEAKKVEVAKIVSMLSEKLPPEKGQRLKAWMRISMLGNPKTQVRNVAGNAIIQPVNWVGDVFSATADKIMSKKTGVRTMGTTNFGTLSKGSVKGFKDAVRDAKTGVDTRDINLDRFEENIGAKPFYEGHKSKVLNAGAKVLNKTNKILGNVMSGGDRIFYQAIYDNSLQNQMKLNKVDAPTQEMMDIAEQEALSRTWNDSNEYTKSVLQIRNAMNKLNVKGYGLGDVLVPFAKTPANLTKAIVDYSPIGLTKTILSDGKKLKNSLENGQYSAELQHKFADSLGKGFAGSLLWLTAYGLAQAGITSGASDDDKDVASFMRNTLGIQPYSVKVGDKSFTYDWAQPIAAPFAAMADYKKLKDSNSEEELLSSLKGIANSSFSILLDQSFLSSISEVFNSYTGPVDAMIKQLEGLPARATPTFFKQIADLIDPTSRQTYVKGEDIETIKNQVLVKIPGKSKELVSQRDTLGREIKKYGGDEDKLKYAFNVFLNPANTNKGKTSPAAEEIYAVYKATGDKTIMPRQVGYSENIGGTTRNLTAKERSDWQKLSGEKIEENVKALTQNPKYKSMSDEDKAAVINGIVNYSFAKAKSDLFNTQISTMYKTAAKKEEQGIALYDYYIDRISKRK